MGFNSGFKGLRAARGTEKEVALKELRNLYQITSTAYRTCCLILGRKGAFTDVKLALPVFHSQTVLYIAT